MNPHDWVYLGEGNLHLVVRYIGQHSDYKGKVLRVLKGCENDHASSTFKQAFLEHVIQPLLGEEYVVSMIPIHTSVEFLQTLADIVEPHRPTCRKNKQILIHSSTSFLLQDLSRMWPNAIAFELKPKWGFKPQSPYTNAIKSQVCRFCMHSHLRKVSQTTYCPLDLYSNDPTRVKDALHVLLTDATMKKTLKIDGYDAALNEIILNILMNDRILQILKHLQQKLDALDIEYIYPVYQHHGTLITDDIDVWKKVVAQFKLPADLNKEKEEIQRIYEYVLSMTFKDCSLMINAEKTQQVTKNTITLKDGSMYRYDIKVIDTDLKSIDKIPFWYQLDQSIINHAIDTQLVKNKRCIL